jgi:hypothetical protein
MAYENACMSLLCVCVCMCVCQSLKCWSISQSLQRWEGGVDGIRMARIFYFALSL